MADDHNTDDLDNPSESFARLKIPRELEKAERRKQWGLPEDNDQPGPYIIELNLQHIEGLPGAAETLRTLCAALPSKPQPRRVAKTYYACQLKVPDVGRLVADDERHAAEEARKALEEGGAVVSPSRYTAIYRIWPDFKVKSHIDHSIATVKADAALNAYSAQGEDIVWAVIDSGVDARHPHFGDPGLVTDEVAGAVDHRLVHEAVASLHRCFCEVPVTIGAINTRKYLDSPDDTIRGKDRKALLKQHRAAAFDDAFGHGTHVAGIIAGGLTSKDKPVIFERVFKPQGDGASPTQTFGLRRVARPERLRGVAPRCHIVSLRVLDEKGEGRTSDVISALEYIREKINDDPKLLRVHGVNLSVGYEYDAELFACGQSPVCAAADRLVQAGVVVVTAAGNTGYGHVQASQRVAKVGLSNTINDPGNAALAITVGATHRDSPHTYGVSYFSSKGPTGDGRLKPDLVAPGERITSCAAGQKLNLAKAALPEVAASAACYVDDSGTSMAAPHVSGAIAAFLSIRREFIGRPLEVKRIFLESATPLGRERYFEGHGLLDLMRAIQAV